MEQIQMAPIGPVSFILGKTVPYLVLSFISALLIVFAAMLLFDLPMRGSWWLLLRLDRAVSGRRTGTGAAHLHHRRNRSRSRFRWRCCRRSCRHSILSGFIFPISSMPVVIQWVSRHRAGALLPRRAPRHRAQGRRRGGVLAAARRARDLLDRHARACIPAAAKRMGLRRVAHLVRKEFIELRQDPRLFGIVILAPIIQLGVLGYAATTDVKDVPTVIVDADRSAESRRLVDRFEASANFKIVGMVGSTTDIDKWLDARRCVDGAHHSARLRPTDCRPAAGRAAGGCRRHRFQLDECRHGLRPRAGGGVRAGAGRGAGGFGTAARDARGPRLVQSAAREPRLHDPGHRCAAAAGRDDEPVGDGDRAREGDRHARAVERDAAGALGADRRQAASLRAHRHRRRRAGADRRDLLVRGADARQHRAALRDEPHLPAVHAGPGPVRLDASRIRSSRR